MKIILLVSFLMVAGCEKIQTGTVALPDGETPPVADEPVKTQKEKTPTPLIDSISLPNMLFHADTEKSVLINVEVADTPDARRKGLMHRNSLQEHYGMLFVFEQETHDPFWMKDTFMPLDLVFFDKDYYVIDLIEKTEPLSEKLLLSREPYRYVLEINGGHAKKHDIRVGDLAQFRLGPK